MYVRQTSGIVLKLHEHGESDKIVTLYCPDAGKLTCIAKGAKRSVKRFMNKLEIFTLLDFHYNRRYAMPLLENADLLDSFLPLRRMVRPYTAAALVCELLLHWTHENDGDPELFTAACTTLARLSQGQSIEHSLVLFLARLYTLLGYQPALNGCSSCGRLDLWGNPYRFKADQGAIICHQCQPHGRGLPELSLSTIKLLSGAANLEFEKTPRLRFSGASLAEALLLFRKYTTYLLDREINAWVVLDTL